MLHKNRCWYARIGILIFWMFYKKMIRKRKVIGNDEYASLTLNVKVIYCTCLYIAYMIFLDYLCFILVCRKLTMRFNGGPRLKPMWNMTWSRLDLWKDSNLFILCFILWHEWYAGDSWMHVLLEKGHFKFNMLCLCHLTLVLSTWKWLGI